MANAFTSRLGRLGPIAAYLLAGVVSVQAGLGQVVLGQVSSAGPVRPLGEGTALYARAIRTARNPDAGRNGKIVVSVTAISDTGSEAMFYTGDAASGFRPLSSIRDPSFAGGLCCGTLYELPQKLGSLEAGTLLWAGSVGLSSRTAPMRVEIFASRDGGQSWTYLSGCAATKQPRAVAGGLWEPEFTTAADGALVCFYSDETQPGHSQVIGAVRSLDGVHWSPPVSTVAVADPKGRPGMPVVTRLRRNLYFMTYEACGVAACAVFSRTSPDGWRWGDPLSLGSELVSATGSHFAHAPTNTPIHLDPALGPAGDGLLAVGQMLVEADGSVSKRNGEVVFLNRTPDGSGPWEILPAPVPVPEAFDNYCPNYSSPLLPSPDGKTLLEFASRRSGGVCRMYYSTETLGEGTVSAVP